MSELSVQDSLNAYIGGLPSGSTVGVLFLQGSLCPITRGHALTITEGRSLLLGQPLEHSLPVPCPLHTATPLCTHVVAIIGLNDTHHVRTKLAAKGEAALSFEQRSTLCQLALPYPWVFHCPADSNPFRLIQQARAHAGERLSVVSYQVSGTDDALLYGKWSGASASGRLYIPLRSPNPADEDTQALLAAMGSPSAWPHVLLGPGLPSHSSTAARRALAAGEDAAAEALLAPAVAAWLREQGPWGPGRAATAAWPPGPWACAACTFENNPGAAAPAASGGPLFSTAGFCGGCGSERPASQQAAAGAAAAAAPSAFTLAVPCVTGCGFTGNPATEGKCSVCWRKKIPACSGSGAVAVDSPPPPPSLPPVPFPRTWWVDPPAQGRSGILGGPYPSFCPHNPAAPGATTAAEAAARRSLVLHSGVRTFVCLQAELLGGRFFDYREEVAAVGREAGAAVTCLHFPITDMSVPASQAAMGGLLAALAAALAAGQGPVYLHCWGGHGRTGTVAACWLVAQGATARQALAAIQQRRSGDAYLAARTAPEMPEQIEFVEEFHRLQQLAQGGQ